MDAAGLAIGLVGLPNDLLDLHERWDSARDFDSQYRQALNTWDYSRLRIQEWISYSGFDGEKLEDDHRQRLDDPNIFASVKNNFVGIRDIGEWLVKRQERLRIDPSHTRNLSDHTKGLFLSPPGLNRQERNGQRRAPSPARGRISWVMHGKQFKERVNNLEGIVDRLYELVPPSPTWLSEPQEHSTGVAIEG